MRRIFIGDTHGCFVELAELLNKVKPTVGDHIVFLGDLIHKGPKSKDVLTLITTLKMFSLRKMASRITVITGNHEEKHLRWFSNEERRLLNGTPNPMKHVKEYPSLILCKSEIEVMSDSYICKKFGNIWAVHGGMPGNLQEAPKDLHYQDWLALKGKERNLIGKIMRVRFQNGEGKPLGLGTHTAEDKYWADTYDGRYGTVVFGHNPFMQSEPRKFPHAIGIDLGCALGGHLCALIEEQGCISYETVKAKNTYAGRANWLYE